MLNYALDSGASDLHLSTGSIPMVRIHGEMKKLQLPEMDNPSMATIAKEILNDSPELTDVIDAAIKEQEGVQVGVVAQELQSVLPELVQEEITTVLSVVPTELKWYLVNAVQELSAQVKELSEELATLKKS